MTPSGLGLLRGLEQTDSFQGFLFNDGESFPVESAERSAFIFQIFIKYICIQFTTLTMRGKQRIPSQAPFLPFVLRRGSLSCQAAFCLGFPSIWNYRHVPPFLAYCNIFPFCIAFFQKRSCYIALAGNPPALTSELFEIQVRCNTLCPASSLSLLFNNASLQHDL